jgi:NAD+ synthase
VNPTVGDVTGNAALVRRMRDEAASRGADLVVFPELVLVGYPPEDLVLRPALVDAAAHVLRELVKESRAGGAGLLVTLPWRDEQGLHNSVALVVDGQVEIRSKHELPNYGVFDEKRVFVPGGLPAPIVFRGVRIGIPICEDIWLAEVTSHLARQGAELLIVPNGSPFEVEKFDQRIDLARARVAESGLPLIYVNQVGGQDELVFDGGSFAINQSGGIAHVMPFWTEALEIAQWERSSGQFIFGGGTPYRGTLRCAGATAVCRLSRDDARAARLCGQEPLPRHRSRPFRRHRLGSDSGCCGRRTGSGTRARRAIAVAIYQRGQHGRRC